MSLSSTAWAHEVEEPSHGFKTFPHHAGVEWIPGGVRRGRTLPALSNGGRVQGFRHALRVGRPR